MLPEPCALFVSLPLGHRFHLETHAAPSLHVQKPAHCGCCVMPCAAISDIFVSHLFSQSWQFPKVGYIKHAVPICARSAASCVLNLCLTPHLPNGTAAHEARSRGRVNPLAVRPLRRSLGQKFHIRPLATVPKRIPRRSLAVK